MKVHSIVFLIIALCPQFAALGMRHRQIKFPRVRHTPPTEQTRLHKLSTGQLINEILRDYKIRGPKDCIVYVTKKINVPQERFGFDYPQACVVAGMKNVFIPEGISADEALQEMNPKIKELLMHKDSPIGYFVAKLQGEPRLYLYEKARHGEINAYKLAKAFLEQELADTSNWYLTGHLLDYPEDAIKFFYTANDFIAASHNKQNYDKPLHVSEYHQWPIEIKKQFDEFEKTGQAVESFNKDKKNAAQWLQENSHKTAAELKAEILQLERQVDAKKAAPKKPSITPPSEKKQEKVTIFDYDPKRDFTEIKKIYDTMDEQTIKVLGRGIPEAIANYPMGSRSDKYQMLDGTEVSFDIKVLRSDKNLVGFIVSMVTQKSDTHEITQCKIAPIVIAPEFRGKGYGTNLMQASVDYFTHEGCKTVLLEVHPENAGAIKLYTRMGFKEIGRDQDSVTMEWPIPIK